MTLATQGSTTDHHAEQYDVLVKRMQAAFLQATLAKQDRLYTTDADNLYEVYLSSLPEDRQYHTCHCCKNFIERFGGLVTIDENGIQKSAMWYSHAEEGFYAPVVQALRSRVNSAKVTGVFYSSEKVWGTPQSGGWDHFALYPTANMVHKSPLQTAYQAYAEKREDYKNMITALKEYSEQTVNTAVTLLKTDSLYRSEKVLGVAEWLLKTIQDRAMSKDSRTQRNRLWRAVALAPIGYAHPRSSMIGTLLDDIAAGDSYESVSKKFKSKMDPLQYLRPQAAPAAGAIAQAEKIVETMGIAPSLERRFARLEEIQKKWEPAVAQTKKAVEKAGGVFSHLKAKDQPAETNNITVPAQVMTWVKFQTLILPTAEKIEAHVPSYGNFGAYVTAVHDSAPPILQWDSEEKRNPVSWYLYKGGSSASRWSLKPHTWAPVTAISDQPSSWYSNLFRHQGEGVMFVLKGAQDLQQEHSLALFPEILRSELHAVRSVIEAHSNAGSLAGKEEASACGLLMQRKNIEPMRLRVTSMGSTLDYTIDRWD